MFTCVDYSTPIAYPSTPKESSDLSYVSLDLDGDLKYGGSIPLEKCMYTKSRLEEYAGKSSTCKGVFASVITGGNAYSQTAAKGMAEGLARKVLEANWIEVEGSPIAQLQGTFASLDDLFSALMRAAAQKPKSMWRRLFFDHKPGEVLALRMMAETYSLDLAMLNSLKESGSPSCLDEIFHAIILSGIYLALPEQETE